MEEFFKDLALVVLGAVLAYTFSELRGHFDRQEQKAIRSEEREERAAEAAATRHWAIEMESVAATRKVFMSMLDHRIELGAGNAAMVVTSTDCLWNQATSSTSTLL